MTWADVIAAVDTILNAAAHSPDTDPADLDAMQDDLGARLLFLDVERRRRRAAR